MKAWPAGLAPGRGLRLNASLSARWLNGTGLTAEVLDTLAETGPDRLDDFGTGYSSLAHLLQMPVDVIKLDRCFVAELGTDTDTTTTAIAETVVRLGARLHLDAVAEGIETMEQAERISGSATAPPRGTSTPARCRPRSWLGCWPGPRSRSSPRSKRPPLKA